MVNLTPVSFICGLTRQERTGIIQVYWDPEISVSVITTVGVPVEEDLADIGMKSRNVVIHMVCDGEESWIKTIGEVWPTPSVDKWLDSLTKPSPGEE